VLKNVGLPDKTYCTVYYTVAFLCCKSLKYIDIPAATNSSKAEVARSNRAGQAKSSQFNIVLAWSIVIYWLDHDPAWLA